MFKNVKKKILLSLGVIILSIVMFGNIYVFAADSSTLTITPKTSSNTTVSANTEATNTSTNAVNATTNTSVTAKSTYNATNTAITNSNLPHTGSDSKVVLFVILFAVSAIYAYKKVRDYNM